jgi:hypothetical protein
MIGLGSDKNDDLTSFTISPGEAAILLLYPIIVDPEFWPGSSSFVFFAAAT